MRGDPAIRADANDIKIAVHEGGFLGSEIGQGLGAADLPIMGDGRRQKRLGLDPRAALGSGRAQQGWNCEESKRQCIANLDHASLPSVWAIIGHAGRLTNRA